MAKTKKSKKTYIEDERIFMLTGKTSSEVLNEYTLPELFRLQALLVFLEGVPL